MDLTLESAMLLSLKLSVKPVLSLQRSQAEFRDPFVSILSTTFKTLYQRESLSLDQSGTELPGAQPSSPTSHLLSRGAPKEGR